MTVEEYIKENPTFKGWWCKNKDDIPGAELVWYFIDPSQPTGFCRDQGFIINNHLYIFGVDGLMLTGFVQLTYDANKNPKPILNILPQDINPKDFRGLLLTNYVYCNTNDVKTIGQVVIGTVRLKLKDKKYHTFLFNDSDGTNCKFPIFEDKLNINGFVVDRYLFEGPSLQYGPVHTTSNLYLCDKDAHILNTQKSKYVDKKHIYYVNSDKTFFYSTDEDDPRWY